MNTPSVTREHRISALEEAGWSLAADRIIHGLCHDLSGRASAMGGLTYLMDDRSQGVAEVLPLMTQELGRLEEAVRLLRLLPDDSTVEEILAPGEILGDVARLVRTQRGLENVEVVLEIASDAPAVRMDRTIFVRSLALLLTGAAERALLAGAERVTVRAGTEANGLVIELAPFPEAGDGEWVDPVALPQRILPLRGMREVGKVLAASGVGVEELRPEDGEGTLSLTYPPPFSS